MHAADRHVWVRLPFWLMDFPGLVLDERPAGTGRELLVQHVDVDGRAVLDWRKEWEVISAREYVGRHDPRTGAPAPS